MAFTYDFLLSPGLLAARPAAGVAGRIYYATDAETLTYDNGAAWVAYAPTGGGLYEAYCCVIDQKAQGTDGGGFVQGAWRTRDINTEQADPDGIVALAGNQITLDAGTYRCIISAPAFQVFSHQTRLYNTTDASVEILGTCEYTSAGGLTQSRSFIVGRFTVGASKALEVQHYCAVTVAVNGYGAQKNITNEIYTIAEFFKEA